MRFVDILLAATGIIILLPIMVIILVLGFFDTGSPLFRQERIGKNKTPFQLIKFRSMKVGTANVATHMVPATSITPMGRFLRKSKLDELPQLFNVIIGDMSLVGPRPGLPAQKKLLEERQKRKVFDCRPGITGLAQIKNIDMSTPKRLARYDQLMLKNINFCCYFKIILLTALGKGLGDRVT